MSTVSIEFTRPQLDELLYAIDQYDQWLAEQGLEARRAVIGRAESKVITARAMLSDR